ncbi:MAG: HdeD family acid-resistance protein [Rhizobiales bacterium]|nr:HdeD family acid-resistance protein [Hyphomicrobiales bacterium]
MSSVQAPQAPGGHGSLAPGAELLHSLARNWWLEVLRGVAAIIFGVLAFAWPGITLLTLVLFYGAFALIDGVLAIVAAIKGGNPMPRWWLALVGVAGIVAGLLTFVWPGITAFVLLIFIAVWAIILGAMEIYGAFKLRKEIEGEWLLVLNGIISVLFGLALLWRPGVGALAVVWIIGFYAVVLGIIYVMFGLKLRKHQPDAGTVAHAA